MNATAKRRMLAWGIVAAILLVLIVLALMPRAIEVDIVEVTRGPLRVTLDHEGKTRVRDRFVVSAPLPGRVLRIELEPGDRVAAGDTLLATLEPSDPVLLDSRSRKEAEARLRSAQAGLDRARAEREQAQTERDFAVTEQERTRRLKEQGFVSDEAMDYAQAQARVREDALQAAEAAVRNARHELEVANARLIEPGERTSGGTRSISLRSPVDGVVLRRLRESESVVAAGEPLMEVGNPADLEVVADFLSTDAVKMRPGMPVLIDEWGGDAVLHARLRRVEPSGFLKISALGVEEQRVNVIADFDDAREAWQALGDEYRVEMRVVVWEGDDVVTVPAGALFREGGGWAVFAVVGGRAVLRPVETGPSDGLATEVREGVDAGDRVVLHPPAELRDGERVGAR